VVLGIAELLVALGIIEWLLTALEMVEWSYV